ncbi:hypothetical protein [Actomonas aquatica]|uniref:Uncharacterized protein n=1 Tax=Actomonas aquatica TaxID=2866162 RepID=A0ABZ1C295_9BACT|nr:hypothetical protein [Opitutus sp. WL0086]WRQ85531.1 hypothetical protein K1X11_012030 [Opitutus sp. WL0086]
MRILFAIALCVYWSGCVAYRPDQRVVGSFDAQRGESLIIGSDGRIYYVADGKEEFVGLVTVSRESPLTIRILGPDTSPLVGTEVVFSDDREFVSVDWQDMKSPEIMRSSSFKKKEPIQSPQPTAASRRG